MRDSHGSPCFAHGHSMRALTLYWLGLVFLRGDEFRSTPASSASWGHTRTTALIAGNLAGQTVG